MGVKFATLIFGINEISLRLIPFISGILSIFVFYKLSKITLNTKPAVIFANLLFAINFPLVRYASEFKQYSTDVLIFMLIFIWISKINLQNPGFKTILKYSAVFTVLFFIFLPSIFLLSGFILYEILYRLKSEKYANIKDLAKIISMALIPLIFVFMYKFSLPDDLSGFMDAYWTKEVPGFIAYDSILEILKENCSFFALGARYMIFFAPFVLDMDKTPFRRVTIFLNDTKIGRFIRNNSPQEKFYLPPHFLKKESEGENVLKLVVWEKSHRIKSVFDYKNYLENVSLKVENYKVWEMTGF